MLVAQRTAFVKSNRYCGGERGEGSYAAPFKRQVETKKPYLPRHSRRYGCSMGWSNRIIMKSPTREEITKAMAEYKGGVHVYTHADLAGYDLDKKRNFQRKRQSFIAKPLTNKRK